ncbi:MAG TPA: hypothetical protein VHC22_01680 [Pirellulales bacterium]|nr:hypothetical protein [Pirellulales bacterium]
MLIQLEFNELCPDLMARFMREGILPNFTRLYESAAIFTTDAGEGPPNLEPWIQWVTVHSGMPYRAHRAFHLGEGRQLREKCVARLLSEAGVRVGVCGSMNTNYSDLNGYFIPDPWDQYAVPHPTWIMPYYKMVSRHVQESSRPVRDTMMDAINFAWFMMRNGLQARTALGICRQLIAERLSPALVWRRPLILELMQYDLFRRLNSLFDVQYATLFYNSTAHFQHYYWRNMDPTLFDHAVPETDHRSLGTAIRTGYVAMDRLLGRVFADYPRARLLLCTALSQQAWTSTAKCAFRPRDFARLLEFAGIPAAHCSVRPVMAEEFYVDWIGPESADALARKLAALTVNNIAIMNVERQGTSVFTGCRIHDSQVARHASVRAATGESAAFTELFEQIHTMRSGRHHAHGMLWVQTGKHEIVSGTISLCDIAPTVLGYFGIEAPSYMEGRSLKLAMHAPLATAI